MAVEKYGNGTELLVDLGLFGADHSGMQPAAIFDTIGLSKNRWTSLGLLAKHGPPILILFFSFATFFLLWHRQNHMHSYCGQAESPIRQGGSTNPHDLCVYAKPVEGRSHKLTLLNSITTFCSPAGLSNNSFISSLCSTRVTWMLESLKLWVSSSNL